MTNTVYRTQAEAQRDARIAIWGDLPLSKRPFVQGEPMPNGLCENVVAANVNGRLVVFFFDQFGRPDNGKKPVLVLDRTR